MNTIWSYIIWEKLDKTDYKIHEEPLEKTEKLVLDYFQSLSLEEFEEELNAMSWFDVKKNTDYYDGSFHKIYQGDEKKNYLNLHDTGVLPTLLKICVALQVESTDLKFIARMLEVYYSKH